jgi:hypothetical protein
MVTVTGLEFRKVAESLILREPSTPGVPPLVFQFV